MTKVSRDDFMVNYAVMQTHLDAALLALAHARDAAIECDLRTDRHKRLVNIHGELQELVREIKVKV